MQVLAKVRSHEWSVSQGLLASLVGVALTFICAQIRIPLPFTPIPVTMQCFAVICCGLLLGKKWGTLSQIIYAGAGFAGLPIFTGFKAGFAQPTLGYLFGFIVAAYVIGLMMDMTRKRTFHAACIAGMVGIAIIYLCGVAYLGFWLKITGGKFNGWSEVMLGAAPFVGWDAVKVVAAAMLCVGKK